MGPKQYVTEPGQLDDIAIPFCCTAQPQATPRPRALVELVQWQPAGPGSLPDDATTVLMLLGAHLHAEPVWPGYWDSEADTWRDADGAAIDGVLLWADMPGGPAQPLPAV